MEAIAYGILYQLCGLMWKKYDRDDSGSISSKELSKLLKTEAALYCSNDTCQGIVDILDVDGDGEASLYGLASFLHKVHMVPEDARNEYKARGTSHEALIDFSEVMLSKLFPPEGMMMYQKWCKRGAAKRMLQKTMRKKYTSKKWKRKQEMRRKARRRRISKI